MKASKSRFTPLTDDEMALYRLERQRRELKEQLTHESHPLKKLVVRTDLTTVVSRMNVSIERLKKKRNRGLPKTWR